MERRTETSRKRENDVKNKHGDRLMLKAFPSFRRTMQAKSNFPQNVGGTEKKGAKDLRGRWKINCRWQR